MINEPRLEINTVTWTRSVMRVKKCNDSLSTFKRSRFNHFVVPDPSGCKSHNQIVRPVDRRWLRCAWGKKKLLFYFASAITATILLPNFPDYRNVKPFDRVKSTPFFSCSSVRKIKIVVGCSRIHAGTHPLNMNIAPSLLSEDLITPSVDWQKKFKDKQLSV